MSTISTHVLDTARGTPASGVAIELLRRNDGGWDQLCSARTNVEGRVQDLCPQDGVPPGVYKLFFDVADYYGSQGVSTFYPEAAIVFTLLKPEEHYHVPLVLSPFGYSTYRGT
jgi:5-hydroxyisourate hydrolase